MTKIISACDAFVYDEDEAVSIKKFIALYGDKFPMLAIMIDGICGVTLYDCYDCNQVFRIHGYTSQPRVVAVDSSEARFQWHSYVTIPVKTHAMFKVIKSHLEVGTEQSLETILSENELPVLVEMAVGPGYTVHSPDQMGSSVTISTLLITKRYDEHFLMINCINHAESCLNFRPVKGISGLPPELHLHKQHCLVTPCGELTATPITGFRYRSEDEFAEYLTGLEELVATGGEVYDFTRGNSVMDLRNLESGEIDADLVTSMADLFPPPKGSDSPPPPIPSRKVKDEPDGDMYEEVSPDWEPTPVLPPRKYRAPKETAKKEKKGFFNRLKQKPKNTQMEKPVPDEVPEKPKHANISERKPVSTPEYPVIDAGMYSDVHDKTADSVNVYEELRNVDADREYFVLNTESFDKGTRVPPDVQMDTKLPRHVKQIEQMSKIDIGNETSDKHGSKKNKYVHLTYESRKGRSTKEPKIQTKAHAENTAFNADTQKDTVDNINTKPGATDSPSSAEQSTLKKKAIAENVSHVQSMTTDEVASALQELRLAKYVHILKDEMIDGAILSQLTTNDFVAEFGFTRVEALRLNAFSTTGHIPH